jgi:hypothetical protein
MAATRVFSRLSILVLVLLPCTVALGQDLRGMQLFDKEDTRPYGNWAEPNQGFFASFDGLFWNISAPAVKQIGFPNTTRNVFYGPLTTDQVVESNNADTGDLRAKWKAGDRIEAGFMGEHDGFMIGTYELRQQTQFFAVEKASVVFQDLPFGPENSQYLQGIVGQTTDAAGNTLDVLANVPVVFDKITVYNRVKTQGVEAMYIYRPHQLHRGGVVDLMVGARYMQFDDTFSFLGVGGNLADTQFETVAKNRIVGPQIAGRIYQPCGGRFGFSAEGRFCAGLNSETIRQNGILASGLTALNPEPQPLLLNATAINHSATYYEFTPILEFRLEAHAQVTRNIELKAGYNVVWIDNIARGSAVNDYTVPAMGITDADHATKQHVLMNGLNLGIQINR